MVNLGKRLAGTLIRLSPNSLRRTLAKHLAQTAPHYIRGYTGNNGEFLPKTRLSNTTYVYKKENIEIEDNVFIGHYTILDGTGSIKIEEGCQISAYGAVFTHSSHVAIRPLGRNYTLVEEADKPGYIIAPVELGKYAFIGAGAKIIPNSSNKIRIGEYSIVGANSLVSEDVPPRSIVVGSPARVVGSTIDLDLTAIKSISSSQKAFSYLDHGYLALAKQIKESENTSEDFE
jgi:acetyltransferase-like isoleucine patch superfamily enzyme